MPEYLRRLRLVTKQEVAEITTYSEHHIMRLVEAKEFSRPFAIGANRIVWRLIDVEEWIECRRLGKLWAPKPEAQPAATPVEPEFA